MKARAPTCLVFSRQGTFVAQEARPLAVMTGASAGIGFELALCAARGGFDLMVALDQTAIATAAEEFRRAGATIVEPVRAGLATIEGNDKVAAAATGRLSFADAGRGLRGGVLDQDWGEARHLN